MANSPHPQHLQHLVTGIYEAFVSNRLDMLPGLSAAYQETLLDLIQTEGHWALHSDVTLSLRSVASSLLDHKTSDGISLYAHGGKDSKAFVGAFIEYLPVTIESANRLVRSNCSMANLTAKLMKSYYTYQLGSDTNGLNDLIDEISAKHQPAADRLIVDVLNGKSNLIRGADITAVGWLMRSGAMIDKPSEALRAQLREKESQLESLCHGDAGTDRLIKLNTTVMMPVKALTMLKSAGWSSMLEKLISVRSINYSGECSFSGFFSAGGSLPESFIQAALINNSYLADLKFVMAEALIGDSAKFIAAVQSMKGFTANRNAEVWLKTLGDAVLHLQGEGVRFSRDQIVSSIEPLAAKIGDADILRGAALASGIEGKYLAAAPSLKPFKGEFIHRELGL
jgi:hypothetical protein